MNQLQTRDNAKSDAHAAAVKDRMQVLMIGVGGEVFALDAGCLREIIDPVPTTKVAGARAYLPRVINVRGNVIPLRITEGAEPSGFSVASRVVGEHIERSGPETFGQSNDVRVILRRGQTVHEDDNGPRFTVA